MKGFIKPDFKNCVLNISATLAEFLGAPNKNATLPILKQALQSDAKNVVFMCFDGLGLHPLKLNVRKDDFLMRNVKQTLTSTFPSTTTNATTSLLTNQCPLEHGWFGWSMYFQNMHSNVDIFLGTDSISGEKVGDYKSQLGQLNYYFDNAKTDYQINTVFPKYVEIAHPERNNVCMSREQFFGCIQQICEREGKQFIYSYYPEPDSIMHKHGVTSEQAKQEIQNISKSCEELFNSTSDTLFVISADHGQIDVEGYVDFYDDDELMDMLEIYPFLEPRAVAFKVKNQKLKQFEQYFNLAYSQDFELHKSSDLVKQGYFGECGDKQDLLGDYIAICKTNKLGILNPFSPAFKGHHTGLTQEMQVPLILLRN